MEADKIVEILARKIYDKKCEYNKEKRFAQDHTSLYGNHWAEMLHEIGHWIAADPAHRNKPNLGLPIEESGKEDYYLKHRLNYEESLACLLTEKLYSTFITTEDSSAHAYIQYVKSESSNFAFKCGFNDLSKEATELFKQYEDLQIY